LYPYIIGYDQTRAYKDLGNSHLLI